MEAFTPYLIDMLAPFTAGLQIATVIILFLYLQTRMKKKRCTGFLGWVSEYGLLLIFLVTLSAALGSLFFSEIAEWIPCKFCWIQRIFLYPIVFIAGLAILRHERSIASYILLLSAIGFLFSLIHYVQQLQSKLNPDVFDPLQPCDLTGISCRSAYVDFVWGYITIPVMSLSIFVFSGIVSLVMQYCDAKSARPKRKKKR